MFPFNDSYIKKVRGVRPDRLVSLWPQNEPLGHGISTEVIRGYHGAYTNVTLGQTGLQGTGMTSAGFDGATSYNNIHTAGLANDNLLSNPGFETAGAGDPDFWANWTENAGDGTQANEVVNVHEGVDAVKMTIGLGGVCYVNQEMAVVPLTRYRFRFWTRTDAGDNAGRYAVRDVTNAAWITPIVTTGVAGAVYGMVAHEFTAPAGCVLIGVYLHGSGVNTDVCYYDATELRRVDGFLGDEGTIIVPAQVSGAGVWIDGINRYILHSRVDVNNRVYIRKAVGINQIDFVYTAGGVTVIQSTAGIVNLGYVFCGMTWDISAGATGEVMYYINGIASGPTDVGLGTWLGDLSNTQTLLGAQTTVPAAVWSGNIGPADVWSAALTPDEMRYLGTQ